MAVTLNETPSANRLHIGIFGKTNSGKSSFINAFSGQKVSIVADVAGTTTDPVYKAMEIYPLGPCVLIDTAGFDDKGELGALRIEKTELAAQKTDLAIILFCEEEMSQELKWYRYFKEKNTPVVPVLNKIDLYTQEEKEKINITEVVNKDNPVFGTKGGKNTSDKIFLLSLAEVSRKKGGKKYGLLDDEMKACENSDFSKKVSWWWLRSPGDDRYCAAVVNSDGWVYGDGSRVNGSDDGVRPALHLHLSSSNLFSYAGIVSSDGTENEVPYNTRTRLVQN